MGWHAEEFLRSLTAAAPNTVVAYRRDVEAFLDWAERADLQGPEAVDRLLLRRYLSYLATRRYSRRTIARRASALRRYFGWLHRNGLVPADPSRGLSAPQGEGRLPTVLRGADLEALLAPPAGDVEHVALRDQA